MDRRHTELALAGVAGAVLSCLGTRLARRVLCQRCASHGARSAEQNQPLALYAPTPHPDWKPSEPLPPPFGEEYHAVDPSSIPASVLYPLIISSVIPRPIAFVSTVNAAGTVGNLAPYSYFNAVAHDPPTLAIGFCASSIREHRRKDSLVNVLETG